MHEEEIMNIRKKKMEELIRIQTDPITKAKEFAKAIVESEEYRNFIKYNEELQRDSTAQNLLRKFQQKRMELQWKGFNPNTLEELKNLQLVINQNSSIKNLDNAQQKLVDLLQRTNNSISYKIGTQFAYFQGGGCCG